MKRPIQEPVVTAGSHISASHGSTMEHPAYAMIGAYRTSGHAVLYGSDFRHQHYITIRIAKSTLHRSLSNDWPHAASTPYIEVSMSEAQWATFVSTMNVAGGVQCTLASLNGEMTPGLPNPVQRHAQFGGEIHATQSRALDAIEDLRRSVRASGLSAKKQAELLAKANQAAQMIDSNTKYVGEQFAEHMEKVTESAKAEVSAYAAHVMRGTDPNIALQNRATTPAIDGGST